MKSKINKKGQAFETINVGLIGFITFVLVVLLAVLLVSTVKQTSIICTGNYDSSSGSCRVCTFSNQTYVNSTVCCFTPGLADCAGTNNTATIEISDAAYNATKDLQEAAGLPPQFAQIVVIILIITGILSMLAFIGYGAYERLR